MCASFEFCIKQRSVIEFLTLQRCAMIAIRILKAIYGDEKHQPVGLTLIKAVVEVRRDRQRSGCPISVMHNVPQCGVEEMIIKH